MRTYRCVCGSTIFFDNSQCLACSHELGFCPACRGLVALLPQDNGQLHCGNPRCGAELAKCANYSQHQVCIRCVRAPAEADALCDCCRFNDTIPDLNIAGNRQKWYRLEAAKRRLFYDLGISACRMAPPSSATTTSRRTPRRSTPITSTAPRPIGRSGSSAPMPPCTPGKTSPRRGPPIST
jgi:hypothetical protein